jgi:hypothetical protein
MTANQPPDSPPPLPEFPAPPALPQQVVPVLPYARPAEYQSGVMRDGRFIVLPRGHNLPNLCVHCGQPATVTIPVAFPAATDTIVKIHVGMCTFHARRYRIPRTVMGGFFVLAGILFALGSLFDMRDESRPTWSDMEAPILLAGAFLLIGLLLMLIKTPHIWCQKATDTMTWIGGANESFLTQLSPVERNRNSFWNRNAE